MSPTQCPINFSDASFCAWLALLDDRTSKSFLIAVTTQADAPGQVSELSPAESLGRFTKCSLALCLCRDERTDREGAITESRRQAREYARCCFGQVVV